MQKVRQYAAALNEYARKQMPAPKIYYNQGDLWQEAYD